MEENRDKEYFVGALKHAKVKGYAEGVMTLIFDNQVIGKYFKKTHTARFEDTASKLVGEEIKLEVEWE